MNEYEYREKPFKYPGINLEGVIQGNSLLPQPLTLPGALSYHWSGYKMVREGFEFPEEYNYNEEFHCLSPHGYSPEGYRLTSGYINLKDKSGSIWTLAFLKNILVGMGLPKYRIVFALPKIDRKEIFSSIIGDYKSHTKSIRWINYPHYEIVTPKTKIWGLDYERILSWGEDNVVNATIIEGLLKKIRSRYTWSRTYAFNKALFKLGEKEISSRIQSILGMSSEEVKVILEDKQETITNLLLKEYLKKNNIPQKNYWIKTLEKQGIKFREEEYLLEETQLELIN